MKNYRTLDAIVVVSCLGMIAWGLWCLATFKIPEANLPIFSAVLTGAVVQLLNSYAGARWGNKKADEPTKPGDVSLSLETRAPTPDAPASEGT